MAATTINIDGIVTSEPGVFTRTSSADMEVGAQSSRGIVALIGTAEGGIPVTANLEPKNFISLADPIQARRAFRAGALREAAVLAFSPSNDEQIPGGALRVIAMKVNQATQSSFTFNKGDVPALVVTSSGYGAHTEQISVQQQDGTEAGTKHLTVVLEDVTEDVDNIGGVPYFSVRYREDGTGWDNVALQVQASGIRAYAARREAGLEGDAYDLATAGSTMSVVSSSSSDTRRITIYGLDANDSPQTEVLTLNGQNRVLGTRTWNRVYGVSVSAALTGATVTVREGSTRTVATSAAVITSNVLTVTVSSGHRATVGALATVAGHDSTHNIASETAISAVTATSISIPLTGSNGTSGDAVGTVTFYPDVLTLVNDTDGRRKGVRLGSAMFVARRALMLRASGATTSDVVLFGLDQNGQTASELVTLNGTTPVETATTWSQITCIALEDVATSVSVHISGLAVVTTNSVQNTLQKAADHFNARQVASATPDEPYGFSFEILAQNTEFLVENLDLTQTAVPTTNADPTLIAPSGVDVKTATEEFNADLYALASFFGPRRETIGHSTLTDAEVVDFVPKIVRIIITAQNSHEYIGSIDGEEISVESDGSGTVAEIQALFVNAVMRDHRFNGRVSAAAYSTTGVDLTALTPSGFVFTTGDANLVASTQQETEGAGVVPDNFGPTFLQGGEEGEATDADWQRAFDKLRLIRVNTIVPLTGDPAVHAMLKQHLIDRAGVSIQSEADGIVGLSALDENNAPTGELPDKASIKSQILALNSRHVAAVAQSLTRFNAADRSELTTFEPWFLAAQIAGLQAGARTGIPLTEKAVNVIDYSQASDWHPKTDAHEMIQAGLLFIRKDSESEPTKIVRNVSSYTRTTSLLYVERSMNASHNELCYELRRRVKRAVGNKRNKRWVQAAESSAIAYLRSVSGDDDDSLIEGFEPKTLRVRRVNDRVEVNVRVNYPPPINFIDINISAGILND